MKQKAILITMAAVLFLTTSFGCYWALQKINTKRYALATNYQDSASDIKDPAKKLLFMIKSDALVPSGAKKVDIAGLYLRQNQPEKAEVYLRMTKLAEADKMLAEYYLIYAPEKASRYMQRVSPEEKNEYDVYLKIITGEADNATIPRDPVTNIGKLIQSVNTQSFTGLEAIPLFEPINAITNPADNKNNRSFLISVYFIESDLPYLALYNLNALKQITGNTAEIHNLSARAYAKMGKYAEAQNQITRAIALDPSKFEYYENGISYARKSGDLARSDFWSERISELKTLQN